MHFLHFTVLVSHDRDDARPVTTETKSAPLATAAEVKQPNTGVKLPPGRKMSQDNSKSTESPSSERKAGGLLRADDKSCGVESEGKMEVGGSEGVAVVGSKESRTVFVSNLIFSVTEEQLKEKFSEVRMNVGASAVFEYSGTPLLWTPWGPSKVSCIERCPHFRG